MNGLRIRSSKPWRDDDAAWSLEYRFDDLFRSIEPLRDDLFWVLDTDFLHSKGPSAEVFDEVADRDLLELVLFHDESNDWNLVARPPFLRRFSPFFPNDWLDIAGTVGCPSGPGVPALSKAWVEAEAEIYFSCIDGAYWEVYARDEEILKRVARAFPQAESCLLSAKDA